MNKVKDLTKEQIELQLQGDAPQKNALHGHYKNNLSRSIREIEQEKKDILQSILDDGFDPEISTLNSESKVENMKLSEFMGRDTKKASDNKKPKLKLIKSLENNEPEEIH
jgi:hypothetical protein